MRPFVGTMAEDSILRSQQITRHGCNAFTVKRPVSRPMAMWNSGLVWEYIHAHDLPYSTIYDMGYDRTGCMFCCFGVHLESPNRFQRMYYTHPKQWRYCMDKLGLRDVCAFINVPVKPPLGEPGTEWMG